MALKTLPVWNFEPNWDKKFTENLAWLTDIMASRTGSEQRRAMRQWPRRQFEFDVDVQGGARSMFTSMISGHSTSTWYIPVWSEVDVVQNPLSIGTTTVTLFEPNRTQFVALGVAYLTDGNPFNFELVEVLSATSTTLTLAAGVTRNWSRGTLIYPVTEAHLTDVPDQSKSSSNVVSASVRFLETVPGRSRSPLATNPLTAVYQGFPVLYMPPNDSKRLSMRLDNMTTISDNKTSIQTIRNDAGRVFVVNEYIWILNGRREHHNFIRMIEDLRGRAMPIWLPTFMDDLTLSAPVAAGDTHIMVNPCGLTRSGGITRPDRKYILIETVGGVRYYRELIGAGLWADGRERLDIGVSIPADIGIENVLRISFMELCRLNHDEVDIQHYADNMGASEVMLTFRAAPNTRVEGDIFT